MSRDLCELNYGLSQDACHDFPVALLGPQQPPGVTGASRYSGQPAGSLLRHEFSHAAINRRSPRPGTPLTPHLPGLWRSGTNAPRLTALEVRAGARARAQGWMTQPSSPDISQKDGATAEPPLRACGATSGLVPTTDHPSRRSPVHGLRGLPSMGRRPCRRAHPRLPSAPRPRAAEVFCCQLRLLPLLPTSTPWLCDARMMLLL